METNRYTITLEIGEEIYEALEREAQLQGISITDLHRNIYKTYFAMMIVARDHNSRLIVERRGKSSVIREDGFNSLDEVLGDG